MGEIIEFPAYKEAKEKITELKKTLTDLVYEKDNLKFVICENIKTQYMLNFGSLEYNLYKAYCKYLRLRRKKEMIQAKKNRQESIDIETIEKDLDDEFAEYKKVLDGKISDMKEALKRSEMDFLTDEEEILIKTLYKKIVKKIHPDINPAITEEEKEFFYKATDSYKNGDLMTIQTIYDIVISNEDTDKEALSDKALKDEVKRLEGLIGKIQKDIDLIKSQPPYTWKEFVEDKNKRADKLKELKNNLEAYEEAIRTQEEYIKDLMRDIYEWFNKKRWGWPSWLSYK